MPYPGGAALDKAAQAGDDTKYNLPRSKPGANPYDMSFSGLKTAALNLIHHAQQVGEELDRAALARDFAQAVSDTLVPRAMEALRQTGYRKMVAAGGVAANSLIRGDLERECAKLGARLYLPPLKLCGDNGAMIGAQGYYEYLAGHVAEMDLNAYATRDIAE
jgi:N6-L-threonylcarbamoyladenine synthase